MCVCPILSHGQMFFVQCDLHQFGEHVFILLFAFALLRAATDHNSDNTTAILKEWLTVMQKFYHYVEWRPMDQPV